MCKIKEASKVWEYVEGPFGSVLGCTTEDMRWDMYQLDLDDEFDMVHGIQPYVEGDEDVP